jgi:hypothetical protein
MKIFKLHKLELSQAFSIQKLFCPLLVRFAWNYFRGKVFPTDSKERRKAEIFMGQWASHQELNRGFMSTPYRPRLRPSAFQYAVLGS